MICQACDWLTCESRAVFCLGRICNSFAHEYLNLILTLHVFFDIYVMVYIIAWCLMKNLPLWVVQNAKKLSSKLRQKDASTSKNWPNHSNLFNSKLKTASTLPIFVSSPEKMIYVGWQGDTHPALFSFHFLPPTFLKWWIRTICHLRSHRWKQPRNEFKSFIFMIVSLLILQIRIV